MGAFAQALRKAYGGSSPGSRVVVGRNQNISITMTGSKQLDALLRQLPDRAALTAIRQASSNAMTPMLKQARQNAKSVSRTYAKAMGKKQKTYKADGTVVTIVGARKGYRSDSGHDPVYTAHLIEFGTQPHSLGRGSSARARGSVSINQSGPEHPGTKGQHVLQRAFDSTRSESEAVYRRELARKLVLQVERLAAKLGTKRAA